MSRLNTTIVSSITVALMLFASTADARFYRYKDENGQLVISTTVPQEASIRGYEIINDSGRVIKTIAPAPTAQELADRAERARKQVQLDHQRQTDRLLLRQFSHPDDAVLAMNRKLQELSSLIQLKRGNISGLISQLDEEQRRAANLERSGLSVPHSMLEKINRLQAQVWNFEQEIAIQNIEIDTMKNEFIKDIKRLEEITGEKTELTINIAPNEQ